MNLGTVGLIATGIGAGAVSAGVVTGEVPLTNPQTSPTVIMARSGLVTLAGAGFIEMVGRELHGAKSVPSRETPILSVVSKPMAAVGVGLLAGVALGAALNLTQN